MKNFYFDLLKEFCDSNLDNEFITEYVICEILSTSHNILDHDQEKISE